jgi:biopolymer transport protein ExbD
MKKTDHTQKASGVTCLVVGLVMGMLLCIALTLVAVAAGALLYVRSAQQRQLAVQQQLAAETMRARMEAAIERTESEAARAAEAVRSLDAAAERSPHELIAPTLPILEIAIDHDGRITSGVEPLDPSSLKTKLQTVTAPAVGKTTVVIRVDGRCLFADVAAAMAVCREAGISDVRVKTLGEP